MLPCILWGDIFCWVEWVLAMRWEIVGDLRLVERGVKWFYCGEMGDLRSGSSMIFAGECGGMTIPFVVGFRFFFGEK